MAVPGPRALLSWRNSATFRTRMRGTGPPTPAGLTGGSPCGVWMMPHESGVQVGVGQTLPTSTHTTQEAGYTSSLLLRYSGDSEEAT